VNLHELESGGARKPVWHSAAPVRSKSVAAGQEIAVLLPAGLLVRADYLIEAYGSGRQLDRILLL